MVQLALPALLGGIGVAVLAAGSVVQAADLLANRVLTATQVTRRSASRAVRAEARALLLGAVGTVAITPAIGFLVNEATRLFDEGVVGWGLLLLAGTSIAVLILGAVAISRVMAEREAGASTWSALARDIEDAAHQQDFSPALLASYQANTAQLHTADARSSRRGVHRLLAQSVVERAAATLRLDRRNRGLAAKLVGGHVVVLALRRPRFSLVRLVPVVAAILTTIGLGLYAPPGGRPIPAAAVAVIGVILVGGSFALTAAALREYLIYLVLQVLEDVAGRARAVQALAQYETALAPPHRPRVVRQRRRGLQLVVRMRWLR